MAAAAMTPRWFETALMPANLPGVIFTVEPPQARRARHEWILLPALQNGAGPISTGRYILTEGRVRSEIIRCRCVKAATNLPRNIQEPPIYSDKTRPQTRRSPPERAKRGSTRWISF